MKINLSALQCINLDLMLGIQRCENIKDMTELAELYKIVKLPKDSRDYFIVQSGNEIMLQASAAENFMDVELTLDQARRLKSFIEGWRGGWTIKDHEWVSDVLSKLNT